MLSNLRDMIKNNFSPLDVKIWLVVIIGIIAYFAGRCIGILYSYIINS